MVVTWFSYYQHELPLYWLTFEMLQGFGKSSPESKGVDFGQFLGHGDRFVRSHDFNHLGQCFQQSMRRFVKDHGFLHLGKTFQQCFFAFLVGQKTIEIETAARKAGLDKCGHEGCGAGQAFHLNFLFQGFANQKIAGVGYSGGSRIADQRGRFNLLNLANIVADLLVFVEDMVRHAALALDFVMLKQVLGSSRVFTKDQVRGFQNVEGAEGDVFQIADRSRHNE